MAISNEKHEETSYFTVEIHKSRSSIFSSWRLLRVQKQMDSSAERAQFQFASLASDFFLKKV